MSDFRIMDGNRCLERHTTEAAAVHAFWVLTMHEMRYGRPSHYTVHPAPKSMNPPDSLPSWVTDLLKEYKII